MTDAQTTALLERYSKGELSATELRRVLGGITFGDVLVGLAQRDLPLPRASQAGREKQIATARSWLFPPAA